MIETKKEITKLAIAALLAINLVAPTAFAENTIRWSSQSDIISADPHSSNLAPSQDAAHRVYGTLFYRDKDMKFFPWLATGYKLIDSTTWEFSIRKNVRFHDGSSLKANDVKFSFERAQSPTSDYKGDVDFIKEIEVIDDYTVQFITKVPNSIAPNLLTNIFIMSES